VGVAGSNPVCPTKSLGISQGFLFRLPVVCLPFNYKALQQELRSQEIVAKEKRKKNLQLLGIAVFIPAFFGLILFLSKRKVKSRTVEFLGLLALLLLFEFIALFIHPFIGAWTHEAPVWMLLILVCIAAVLVPTHHALEKWLKQKLAYQR
jgi:hypothetical protein